MEFRRKYIERAIALAKNGVGLSRPNPAVGAVIVHQHKIIGEGFTSTYGCSHAEVNAIKSVKNKELLKKSTIYVTLEPCSHYGKTPPCADLIIEKEIPNIVIGCIDDNELVAGKGIEKLRKAGRNVVVGVLEKQCKELHKQFFTVQNKKRPYIVLKWAETRDGFIAPKHKEEQKPVWISNQFSRQLVHKWRAKEHAILIGTTTVLADNPSLNVRDWGGNNPIKIILDRQLRIPQEMTVFNTTETKTIVITEKVVSKNNNTNLIFEKIDFSKQIALQICDVLHKHNIQSILIEGGTKTLNTFIEGNLWDEAIVTIGNSIFHDGVKAPVFEKNVNQEFSIEEDKLMFFENK